MAKYETQLTGDFDDFLNYCIQEVLGGSFSATLEEQSDFMLGDVRIAVRVFERYSMAGSNRLSLNLTLAGQQNNLVLSAMTAGGSQATFFKMNTLGEQSFLNQFIQSVERY